MVNVCVVTGCIPDPSVKKAYNVFPSGPRNVNGSSLFMVIVVKWVGNQRHIQNFMKFTFQRTTSLTWAAV